MPGQHYGMPKPKKKKRKGQLCLEHSKWKQSTPAQRKKNKDNTIKKGKPS